MGEELARNRLGERRKKTPFYRSPRIQPLAAHQPRYYRTARGTTVERYYRPTVLPGRTTGPTTAPNRGFFGSRSGSSHGTTAGRYYRSSGRYYPPAKKNPQRNSTTPNSRHREICDTS